MNDSMMLISSRWGSAKTFKLIPIKTEAPYNEAIFDPETKVLAIVGKEKKQIFHLMPKLDEKGNVMVLGIKNGKREQRDNGKDYYEQRQIIETYYEYFIEDKEEIIEFVETFGYNSDTHNFKEIIDQAYTIVE